MNPTMLLAKRTRKYPTKAAYQLIHDGALALADVSANGMRIDVPYLKKTIAEVTEHIQSLEEALRKDKVFQKTWLKQFGPKAKLGSRPQLGAVLKELGYEFNEKTLTGKDAIDKMALAHIDHPFVRSYERCEQLKKLMSTYLKNIDRETVDGLVHPSFGLHTVTTYRSCVAEGTLIEIVRDVSVAPKGVPIERVKVGDYAYCYDENKQLVIRKVLWAGKTGHKKVVRLHWSARGKHGFLDVTPEHLVRVASGAYVEARNLRPGNDFRLESDDRHLPKLGVMALGRVRGTLYPTRAAAVHDHRLVYSQLVGPLAATDDVHHRDKNHLNNTPTNLEPLSRAAHSRLHHTETLASAAAARGRETTRQKILSGEIQYGAGPESRRWKKMTRWAFLRMVAAAKGKITEMPIEHGTTKRRCAQFAIDLQAVSDRYNRRGEYAKRGVLLGAMRAIGLGYVKQCVEIGGAKLKRMLAQRGLPIIHGKCGTAGRQRRAQLHNHKITHIEYLKKSVDVYDLEIEECHNFIANEICVHNSAHNPNIQNQWNRNPEMAKILRQAYIPRDGRVIVEIDCAAHEWRIAAAVWKDPNMIAYANDTSKDVHRDMAAEIYCTAPGDVSKPMRGVGKNGFVFPRLYGSYYISIAEAMWDAISREKLETVAGVPVKKMLKAKGITRLGELDPRARPIPGTFVHHIKQVEESFLRRFPVFARKSEEWYSRYRQHGGFPLVTGFWVSGLFSKNFAMNCPVQGPAFHCLLWSLTKINKELKRRKMKTLLIAEVHDSMMFDSPYNEVQDVINLARRVMTVDLPKAWPWICVDLEVEAEVAPTNWYGKVPFELENNIWVPKQKAVDDMLGKGILTKECVKRMALCC